MSEISQKVILLVEDEKFMTDLISMILKENGFDVIIAESGENAIEIVNSGQAIHLILMDIILGDGIDGIEAARIILQDCDIPLIFLSGHTDPEIVKRTESINSYGYVIKQSGQTILLASIKMALNLYEARKKIDRHEALLRKKEWFDNIILESVSDGVIVVNDKGIILFVNQTLENIFGYSSEELIGSRLIMLMPESLKAKHIGAFDSYVTTGSRHLPCWTGLSIPGRHKEGHEISLEVSWSENTSYGQRVFCATIKDVTERKKAEHTIKQQNEFLHTVINALEHPFYVVNTDSYIIEIANRATHPNLPENITCYELIHNLDVPCHDLGLFCTAEEVKFSRKPALTEHIHYNSDGEPFYTEVRSYPIFDENGNVSKVIEYCVDITDRKRKDEELRVSLQKYKSLFDSFPIGIAIKDSSGNVMEANKKFEELLSISPQNIHEKEWHIIRPDGSRMLPEEYACVRVLKEKRVIENVEMGIVNDHGSVRWFSITAAPIPIENYGSAVTYSDITDRKKAELALRKLTDELESRVAERTAEVLDLYNNAPCGYHSLDQNGVFVMINDTELRWLGYDREEIVGKKKFTDLVTETGIEQFQKYFPVFRKQGWIKNLEYEMIRKDGSIMPVLLSTTAVYDSQGKYLTNRATIFDNSERKKAEEDIALKSKELILANAALEKAAHMKDEFLASMSHELRTPLTGVMSLSEALQEQVYGPLNEKQLKVIHRIEESGQHLLDLITDILDLSKVESGQMELQIEKASLRDICQSALQLTKGMANKKRHTVSFSMNPASMTIEADPRRLKQMLVNLLSNAVKFTPDGGKIGLEVDGNETEQVVSLSVTDTGIGIEPKMFSMLFKPFVQLDSSLSRQYAGTGLGLSLVQRMAELHGGSVSLDSELGRGSRFTIHLPRTLTNQHISEEYLSSDRTQDAPLILLVEDNDINISIYSEYLRIKKYSVAVAKNGRDGIEKAKELQPDLILMDIQMPGMDGLEAICILRSDKNSRLASVPIIALTSLEIPGNREQCLASGANEYLSKPVPLDVLVKTIERYLSHE